ncbi:hypothetical protein [Dichotomicrobium thermohalophilum]|uniref:Uncharacterized protein n=1 Tax=Dichotomicrobium thermohalophilum TaxID=933063 RepID=A0A397Q5Y2_9HYPH|nr:hypothetical protein [Dichotomicrobium thermohalophilum]RIA56900.1 hypothetical protein BXY53_2013 [Dichotomicrobium thermohalophilum]
MKQSKSGGTNKSPKQKKAQAGTEPKPEQAAQSKQAEGEQGSRGQK